MQKTKTLRPRAANALPSRETVERLTKAANAGDQQALDGLRALLDAHPVIWRKLGDIGLTAECSLIRSIAEGNSLVEESLMRKTEAWRLELLGDSPTVLETLAVSKIVVCYLESMLVESQYPDPGGSIRFREFVRRQKESADRRFQQAMKSLELARKMPRSALPPVAQAENGSGRLRVLRGGAAGA